MATYDLTEAQRAPETCDQCGSPRTVAILWSYSELTGKEAEVGADGRALLGLGYHYFRSAEVSLVVGAIEIKESRLPAWACLDCAPGWVELHRLANAELEAETLLFNVFFGARDFKRAAELWHAHERLKEAHTADVERLVNDLIAGQSICEEWHAHSRPTTQRAPKTCNRCGGMRIVRILWGRLPLPPLADEDAKAVADESAVVGLGHRHFKAPEATLVAGAIEVKESCLPTWACLDCAPGWSVHRFASQELEAVTAKAAAVSSHDFEGAAALWDVVQRLKQVHAVDVERLLKELIAGREMGDRSHVEPESPTEQ